MYNNWEITRVERKMVLFFFFLLFFLLILFSYAKNSFFIVFISCNTIETSCRFPNDCNVTSGLPYCVEGLCRVCDPTNINIHDRRCMCPPSHYCVASRNDTDYGTCRKLESNILGRNCDRSLQGKGLELIQGVNDTIFCGKLAFNSNNESILVEWEGICAASICNECITSLSPTLPNALCSDGRSCYRGNEVIAYVGVYSMVYFRDTPLFAGYYIGVFMAFFCGPIILLLLLTTIYYTIMAIKKAKTKDKQVHFWFDIILDFVY